MNKILRVNMKELTVKEEEVSGDYRGLGGRALTSAIVAGEVPPLCHPLSGENKLVFAPGLLSGTAAPCSGRISVGAKSPLTGGIKEANSGGIASQKLARLDIAALIIEEKAEKDKSYLLKVEKGKTELMPAEELRGLGNYDTVSKLSLSYGEKVGYISIGQAGEMKMSAASIAVTDMENRPTRHAGRGGLGAVMGSKGLKAIVINDAGTPMVNIKEDGAFKSASRKFARGLKEHPVTGEALPTYGTNVLTSIINEAGAYPARNFSAGQFEGAEKIAGGSHRETILKRGGTAKHPCHPGCTIQCSRIYPDKNGDYLTKGPEYETIWANGGNLGIDDLDTIALMDRYYDDFGLDTIEGGVAIGVAMEAGIKPFGDKEGALDLLREIGKGTPMGKILGSGAAVTGQALGVDRVPVVKKQALPAYDPRHAKGIGVTYATSPMGADHTAGYSITANILKVGGDVDPLKAEGQADLSQNLQIATAALDSTGLCLFVAFCILDNKDAFAAIYEMLNARYGLKLQEEDITALGKKVLKIERNFNEKAGFSKADDRLPYFFEKERVMPHKEIFDVSSSQLDSVFDF